MSKTKKSKLLASMLCATVVAGLYAGPVMAGDASISAGNNGITIDIAGDHTGDDINTDQGIFVKSPIAGDDSLLYKVFGNITITPEQLAAGIKGQDVEFGKVTADTLSVGSKDVVKLNGSRVDVNADVINGGFLKVTSANGEMVFAVDSKGVVKAANGNFGIADDGTVSVGGDETNGKAIINGTTGDITTKGNVYAVNGSFDNITTGTITAANGSFKVDQGNGETVVAGSMVYSKNQNGSYGMLNGNQLTLQGDGNKFSVVNGNVETSGTVNAAKDVVANGTSLVEVGEKTTALENKTTAIEYTPGSDDPNAPAFQKMGTTTIKDKLNADIFSANQGTIGGVTMVGGAITAAEGAFAVDNSGNITANNLVTNKYDVNATFDELTDKMGNVATITVIEDTPKGTITDVASHLNVQGDITANGDVITRDGASLNGLNEQVTEDALKIHNLQVNTAAITRDGEVTTIEGATSFDADGMKMVGDNITDHVTINRNGSMEARNGDASFYFDKNSIALNNGNNSVMVGNESITLSTTGAALTMSKDGLDYADGAFKVAADGSVRIASGTENSITLDAKTGVIYANDFSTGEYSLNAIGDQLNELETGVGEDITDLKRKTTDIEYADGVTTIAGATKFTENGMQVGTTVINKDGSIGAANGNFTVTADGEVIVRGENGATSITGDAITIGDTVIKDGMITTHKAEIGGVEIANGRVDGVDVSELAGSVFDGSKDIAELQRITTGMDYQNGVTSFSGDITFRHNGDTVSLGGLVDKVNDIYDRTSGISKDENGNTVIDGGLVVDGDTTGTGGSITGNGDMNISGDGQIGGDLDVAGSVNAGNVNTGNINAGKGTIGGIHMENGEMTVGDTTVNGDGITVGGIVKDDEGKESGSQVTIDKGDVSVDWVDEDGNKQHASIKDNAEAIEGIYEDMGAMSNRISKVEDRIDKVGAMSAAIANLRTMGYDPTAPTEIAVGIGQYRSETGAALGLFHYPNKDFMLSLSVSTSGDEVMGGIGATWKFGRKTPEQMLAAEKEKAAKAKLAKAEAMKKAAAEAKVAAQQAKHAKMAAEKAAK